MSLWHRPPSTRLSVCSFRSKSISSLIRAYASSTASRPPSGSGLILSFRAAVEPSSLPSEQVLLHVYAQRGHTSRHPLF
nr:MAG TPA: hypothetical protein [Caudoviricetes sp.]